MGFIGLGTMGGPMAANIRRRVPQQRGRLRRRAGSASTPGAGTRTKLVNNLMTVCLCAPNAEALTLASAFGLDPGKTLAGDLAPGCTLDRAHKDLGLILAAGNAAKVPLAATAAIRELYSIARDEGAGGRT